MATKTKTAKTSYLERGPNTYLSRNARERAANGRLLMLERMLELPTAAEKHPSFTDDCPEERLSTLQHQRHKRTFLLVRGA